MAGNTSRASSTVWTSGRPACTAAPVRPQAESFSVDTVAMVAVDDCVSKCTNEHES